MSTTVPEAPEPVTGPFPLDIENESLERKLSECSLVQILGGFHRRCADVKYHPLRFAFRVGLGCGLVERTDIVKFYKDKTYEEVLLSRSSLDPKNERFDKRVYRDSLTMILSDIESSQPDSPLPAYTQYPADVRQWMQETLIIHGVRLSEQRAVAILHDSVVRLQTSMNERSNALQKLHQNIAELADQMGVKMNGV